MVTNWDGLDAKAFVGIYNSNWVCSVGIIKLLYAGESLVSDIPAGDGKIANLFLQCRGGGDLKFLAKQGSSGLSVRCRSRILGS